MAKTLPEYLTELSGWDEELSGPYWNAVDAALADVSNSQARQAAAAWCSSADPGTRAVGLDVLGVLAEREPELLPALLAEAERAQISPDESVRWSAAHALGRQEDERVVPLLLTFLADAARDVRWETVMTLPLAVGDDLPGDHPVVTALMAALEDPDPTVRDWAALGLGSLLEVDTPAVRDALARRLNDEEGDTAGEAALGLARRGDPRVFTYVLARLAEPDVGNLLVEAAGALGDPRLLPLLQRLKADGWQDDDPRPKVLDDALANCSRTHRSPGVVSAMGD